MSRNNNQIVSHYLTETKNIKKSFIKPLTNKLIKLQQSWRATSKFSNLQRSQQYTHNIFLMVNGKQQTKHQHTKTSVLRSQQYHQFFLHILLGLDETHSPYAKAHLQACYQSVDSYRIPAIIHQLFKKMKTKSMKHYWDLERKSIQSRLYSQQSTQDCSSLHDEASA